MFSGGDHRGRHGEPGPLSRRHIGGAHRDRKIRGQHGWVCRLKNRVASSMAWSASPSAPKQSSLADSAESLGSERGIITKVEVDVALEHAIRVERGPAAAAHIVALVGALTRELNARPAIMIGVAAVEFSDSTMKPRLPSPSSSNSMKPGWTRSTRPRTSRRCLRVSAASCPVPAREGWTRIPGQPRAGRRASHPRRWRGFVRQGILGHGAALPAGA